MALPSLFLVLLAQAAATQCVNEAQGCDLEDTVSLVQLSKIAVKRTKHDSNGEVHSVLDDLFAAARHEGEAKANEDGEAKANEDVNEDDGEKGGDPVNVKVEINFANNSANPPPMPCDMTPAPGVAYGAPSVPVVRDSIWGGADNITIVVNPIPQTTTPYVPPQTVPPMSQTGMPVSIANALINPATPGVVPGYNQQVVPGPGMPMGGMGVGGEVPAAISPVGVPVDPMNPPATVGVPVAAMPPVVAMPQPPLPMYQPPVAQATVGGQPCAPVVQPLALNQKKAQTAPEVADKTTEKTAKLPPLAAIQVTAPQAAGEAASSQTGMFSSFAQIIQAGVEKIAEEAAVTGMETGVGKGISRGLQKTGFGTAAAGAATALQTGAAPVAAAPAMNYVPVPAFA
jgi:hypothetical protein